MQCPQEVRQRAICALLNELVAGQTVELVDAVGRVFEKNCHRL